MGDIFFTIRNLDSQDVLITMTYQELMIDISDLDDYILTIHHSNGTFTIMRNNS